jgi:hypothetical protein
VKELSGEMRKREINMETISTNLVDKSKGKKRENGRKSVR